MLTFHTSRFPLFTAIITISLYQTWQFVAFQMNLRHEAVVQQESATKERQQQRERKKNRRDQEARRRKKEEENEAGAAEGANASGDTTSRKVGGRK